MLSPAYPTYCHIFTRTLVDASITRTHDSSTTTGGIIYVLTYTVSQ